MTHRTRALSRWRALAVLALAATSLALGLNVGSAGAQALSVSGDDVSYGAEVDNKFCANLVVEGASDPANLDFAVTAGSLPAGLGIGTGAFGAVDPETRTFIEGTPTTAGSQTFTVTVTDDQGNGPGPDDTSDAADITIEVIAGSSAADVVIAAGRFPNGYTIDCASQASEVQGMVRNLANFGATGTVGQRVAVEDMTGTVDAAFLADVDVLADGWVFENGVDAFTAGELTDIEDWVEAGGVLIAAEDSNAADALGTLFGVPTSAQTLCNHTPSELGDPRPECTVFSAASAVHPMVDGPFGDWSAATLSTSGTVGQYDTDPDGWFVIARNPGGLATVISKRVEASRVILLTDEGLLRTQSYPAPAANATFVGNLFAYALNAFEAPELVNDTVAGSAGEALTADLCANDTSVGDPGGSVIISDGTLPGGLTLDDCTLVGSPTSVGSTVVTYQVTDADGDIDTAAVTISVTQGTVYTCAGQTATIVGTPGADTLVGTSGPDVIVARGGNDTIRGRGGNDVICGGAGADVIKGNLGADLIRGERGNDVIDGNRGNDTLAGNLGRDTVRGGFGTDIGRGNRGPDRIAGNQGPADRCIGGPGPDVILNGCEFARP